MMDVYFVTGHSRVSYAFVQMFGSNLGITYWLIFPVLINICFLFFSAPVDILQPVLTS